MYPPEHVFTGRHYRTGAPVAVHVRGGMITDVLPAAERHDLDWIGPGLVDLQVNGFDGFDLNGSDLDHATVSALTRRLRRDGVTSFLPTLISAPSEQISRSLAHIAAACTRDTDVAYSVAGIHLEGPFISPHAGPRGAHDERWVCAPDWDLFSAWQQCAEGRIRLVTVSPEWPQAPHFIERCTASGVIVAIGHTLATPEQIRAAVGAGARLSTHFGNGARLMLPRHPNELWEQLAADELWVSLIADGFHLPDAVLKVVMRVKGPRAIAISDAVSLAGKPPGRYTSAVGGNVELQPNGRLCLADHPELLAGAARSLLDGVAHLAGNVCDLATAWDMASLRPATFLGLPQRAGLAAGAPADLLVCGSEGGRLAVQACVANGRVV